MSDDRSLLATSADAPSVQRLLALAGAHLARQGFRNWDPPFCIEQVRAEIASRDVYQVLSSNQVVATYALGASAVRPYPPYFWPFAEDAAVYMNRLAVDPAQQGRGIGSWCLAAIHREASVRGMAVVRCDVRSDNAGLRRFYERHGYTLCGERRHSGWRFACHGHRLPAAQTASQTD